MFTLLPPGWHCDAVDLDDRLIFKFPRSPDAAAALVREAGLLAVVRPAVAVPVPDLTLHAGPPLFSHHEKLRGGYLLTADYERLAGAARDRIADAIAHFYAQLHALPARRMRAAGARPIERWLGPEEILAKALALLPEARRPLAMETVSAWANLPPDPHGVTFGFFDLHGWNMAFDHGHLRLNGIYDFADAGFGPLHQEFIYTSFVSPDLTWRIVERYERLTGLALDRRRIALLTGVHRLWELAALGHEPVHAAAMLRHVEAWATAREGDVRP